MHIDFTHVAIATPMKNIVIELTPLASFVSVKFVPPRDVSLSPSLMNGEIRAPFVTCFSRRLLMAVWSFNNCWRIGAGIFWKAASVGIKAVKGPNKRNVVSNTRI